MKKSRCPYIYCRIIILCLRKVDKFQNKKSLINQGLITTSKLHRVTCPQNVLSNLFQQLWFLFIYFILKEYKLCLIRINQNLYTPFIFKKTVQFTYLMATLASIYELIFFPEPTLFSVMTWKGWDGERWWKMKREGYVYNYGWSTLLHSRNRYDMVKQFSSN